MNDPLVSVVIPTRGRPTLLVRAIKSALAQTMPDIEVIVSIDGQDVESRAAAQAIGDDRVRVLMSEQPGGAPSARNAGFVAAKGEWIGLLDDDDEWAPAKLERQLAAAAPSTAKYPIVACALVARSPLADDVWPREVPDPSIPISEYLMVRKGMFPGDRVIQTSTVLARRGLFADLPYTTGLRRHQDWDWLLRAMDRPDTELVFVNEPLAVWYIEDRRATISQIADFQVSIDWIKSVRALVTDRAYASFLLLYPGAQAASAGRYDQFWPLLREAASTSRLPLHLVITYVLYWVLPVDLRRRLRRLLSGKPK